jgi:AraC family transcriptional regulator of adaptative response / DNA-3-methyladenine glycosylase II
MITNAVALDERVCSRARLSRDPRFDGKFFTGVRSTRIYCRSICPVPTVKEKNVRYFPSSAAAAEAGYRPCLRCRPESSPGTPAWLGTSNTVSRALCLIGEDGLDEGGMEGLADRLGVGSRHLRRLFLRHLGAPPSVVAQTRRIHFAKKLLDETSLSMTNVAIASGFGSARRFNAAIRKTYKRTPTQIRRLTRLKTIQPENQYLFDLRFRPPYHWKGMLTFLAARAIPGVEVVDLAAGTYRRSISRNGQHGFFEVSLRKGNDSLALRLQFAEPHGLYPIVERIRGMFDLNADFQAIAQGLGTDAELAKRIRAEPGLRVPGCWDGFELATRAILGQQITVKGATTLASRLVRSFGLPFAGGSNGLTHLFPTAAALADADLSGFGLTNSRAHTVRALARAVRSGHIRFERVADAEALLAKLREIPGIGEWTAHYVAMRALGEPDVLPNGDVGLLRALGLKTSRELETRAESWRPWRSYASMYFWSTAGGRLAKRPIKSMS